MYIYIFGSVCRGDIDFNSDVDLLLITDKKSDNINPQKYSIYSSRRIHKLWETGSPFAWHLYLESKMIYSINNEDFLKNLGEPKKYSNVLSDCLKFYDIFCDARNALELSQESDIFELSNIFLAIRNFAICYSLHSDGKPNFSRNAALRLEKNKLNIELDSYKIFEKARILCTRGQGSIIDKDGIELAKSSITAIDTWMKNIIELLNEVYNV
ncbi:MULTISPECIES: nucleotidyltransferase domain-containing protein [Providencia]|uniref:nucleotidyltransferase domain-containing protein n=1 Tax=Providencia TaxID=586 RepID=UPI0008383EE3|nr:MULTISPECIES: nucleotidyltransferase domain-containing protein [Providencia]MCX9110634.1 nucleotidyltransferase domain-containing protein [Providencia rettgeri]NIH22146.1 nucleotidyltransferase domain-containing protein [Providencia heimbachae]